MLPTFRSLRFLVVDEDGAAASEYAVLVALVIVAIAAAVSLFDLTGAYQAVPARVQGCVDGAC